MRTLQYLRIILTACVVPSYIQAQDIHSNYIRTVTTTGTNTQTEQVDYFDGIGRPYETVRKSFSPSDNDLVSLTEYDLRNRESKVWLPVAVSPTGLPVSVSDYETAANAPESPYGTGNSPYTENTYDRSSYSRIVRVMGPGTDWRIANKPSRTEYGTNNSTNANKCKRFNISHDGQYLSCAGLYPTGSLTVVKETDEDGHTVAVFKDVYGRTVLERRGSAIEHDTYYVYDRVGFLRYVLPPAASDALGLSVSNQSIGNNQILQKYAYYYEYDSKGRCVMRKLPGCDPVYLKYDKAGRLIYTQDGNQRTSSQWTYYLYDIYGRMVVKGVHTAITPPVVDNIVVRAVYDGNGAYGKYSCNVAGLSTTLLEVKFYDSHNFIGQFGNNNITNLMFGYSDDIYGGTLSDNSATAKGLLTGTVIYSLSNPSEYYLGSIHYDERGHVIQERKQNHLGGWDSYFYTLNYYTGDVLKKKHQHTASGKQTITEICQYDYDHAGRLLTETYTLNGFAPKVLASYKYDEAGRVIQKMIGETETVKYNYNIRNWVLSIKSNSFTESLSYTFSTLVDNPSQLCYNGNIAAMTWKTGNDNKVRGYKFSYDQLNRLTASAYGEGSGLSSNVNRYGETFQYDKMGNIEAVTRYGLRDNNVYGKVDDLTFTYNGNQIVKVDDAISGPFYSGAFHFVDGSDAQTEYTYDKNGNMTKDLNKGISSIQYNLLNLPSIITKGNGFMAYAYNAIGEKLHYSREVDYGGNSSCTPSDGGSDCRYLSITEYTDYCGNVIYEGDDFFQPTTTKVMTDEGYITFNGSTPQYHFYLKDHLGNNRVVLNAGGGIEQVNHYYSFGGLMGESTNGDVQPYKYNGKELDRMNGLDWYDYGARHMDGIRFTTIDPMAEKYYGVSPYAYCANNPMIFVDPDGRDIWDIDFNGNVVNHIETTEYDELNVVNSKGRKTASLQYDYGTINHKTGETKEGNSYDMFTIDGDSNGISVFEMLAQNTQVEWSLGQFDESSGNPNVLTTSHSDYSESGMNSYLYNNPSLVMGLKNRIHNHPNSNPDPSFTSRNGSTGGDMEVIHHYDKFYPNNQISYSIYTLYAGSWGYYSYDRNTKADAIRGRQTELLDVFVSGKNKKIRK